MIFNSLTYLVFLTLVVVFYWILPRRLRLVLLLCSSLVFYGFWNFYFLPLLLLSIFVDYVAARLLHSAREGAKRKSLLLISLVTNLSLLAFFKYYYFIADNLIFTAQLLGRDWDPTLMTVLLPIGISFYTFQSVSYTIDVYRRQIEPTNDFFLFASYVTFFPQLVAGPILRAGEVIWQLDKRPSFSSDMFSYGIARILAA
jgi:D-alanyl-lipoteichoic acid acyltransferase DltB (MBOAT superfamily)